MASTSENQPRVPKEVQIARISARQGIMVALITSIAGVIGAFIGINLKASNQASTPPAPSVVHHITIEGADFTCPVVQCAIRVVAEVNGQAYSYPSRDVWAAIEPGMSKEQFPLVSAPEFAVNITGFLFYPPDRIQLLQSQVVNREKVSALPIEREYSLFPVNRLMVRGRIFLNVPTVTVHYRID